jgi:hypothetical protein
VVLFQETFEDNSFTSRGWYDQAMPITTAEHFSGTHALEIHYAPGTTIPFPATHRLVTPTPSVYISYWVKYSTNWVGSGQAWHPHEFMVMSTEDGAYQNPSDTYLALYLEQVYQNGGVPTMSMQDNMVINLNYGAVPNSLIGITESRSTSGCNGVVETNVITGCYYNPPWYNAKTVKAAQVAFQPVPGPGYKNTWNHVEAYYQLNSIVGGIGQANGVMQYWFNGALMIDRHDILYRTGARPNLQFNQFLIAPYIGNGGSPVDQYTWIDDLTVATAKP